MEGLQSEDEIDDEITGGQHALKDLLGVKCRFFLSDCDVCGFQD
jgi:hypothetical protein